ncbi:glycine--tRNA ligase [Candidatus Kaiserbacteria bacterium]|nr:glycine--tRNA ligase [Candidatus Kaiserbacteria bacterium]
MSDLNLMEKIVSLCKRRGFVFPASEIYGGLAGFWDYGPYGVELVNNLKQLWWRKVVQERDDVFGVDGAIIQHPKLWEASGHVAGFTDPLVDCKKCGARHRADHLADTGSTDIAELTELLKDAACPTCGEKALTPPRTYNMMMKTWVGPIEDDSSLAYLRPETAGSIFTNFKNVLDTTHAKLPFGIAQIGKAFRNEIAPRDFIFRVRELEQMEMQYFIDPQMQAAAYESWRQFAWDFMTTELGVREENLQWHEHAENERAHYAAAAHDIYFKFPHGFKELWGTHNRTNFDLSGHARASGQDLNYFDEETKERLTPYVIESSVGVGRMFLAVLADAYREDELGGETRTYLALMPKIAPVKAMVSPLLKNKPELVAKAKEVREELKKVHPAIAWDDNGNIGKRYRRQDEIGTPFCVTIDFDTLGEKSELKDTVTLRHRDSGEQERLTVPEVVERIRSSTSLSL